MAVKDYFTTTRFLPFISGVLMTANFVIFWAVPVVGMGQLYRNLFAPVLKPLYDSIESNKTLRNFAASYVYNNPQHADFFALSLILVLNCSITIPFMFYWQLSHGSLPIWLVYAYYCSWVGLGGSIMGGAYALAHKEGHNPRLYKKWIQSTIGNPFENVLGLFFGNVPWNFTTSHIKIHHQTNGGFGDTFYLWDFDRTDPCGFMLYIHRILLHMLGVTSIRFFRANNRHDKAAQLSTGVSTYLAAGLGVLAITRSFSFVFFVFIEPMLCMTYFLALINIGFHGFLEFDDKGNHISVVDSTTIINGTDDIFGEDDHMAHHYHTGVYFKDLQQHQSTKVEEFKKHRASVFHTLSIAEISIFIILGIWDKLAEHFVDYSGTMSKEEIIELLKVRAKRTETTYEKHEDYYRNPTLEARKILRDENLPFPNLGVNERSDNKSD
mmetsp:Transcript_28872/g.21496  ORF Transcript_28872/g.21496 Transcript_28872/m.21496 type:complete len:438 (-) Transcript_28872:56-1369(-)|eukprot:CAMPEP_0202971908 /NCGR_PEP_ID=MMETSP1396-20130829/32041_1 /ASSEMBLY_ACC=CAM_ASM_000872 /TAXON_ID= /ORGANISM="Pseudokeronopsis sp., Strain Brazil" /LENGTH=437 /DNA_ID=CAMNT_0049701787 /DNA_START=62 /DNA_END=1375 /DNA_ORIENTATION=+